MRLLPLVTLILANFAGAAQTTISGQILEKNGDPIVGANIFLKGTYDGATSNSEGSYSFTTEVIGEQLLIISFLGYEIQERPISLNQVNWVINATLVEAINKMSGVVISAGAFEASDEKKSVILKPLDIVTTAGALADIAGALNTLPGTQTVGETGRLFVRGGSDYETKTFIDGMQVLDEYGATINNVPSRSRFSPFMFKGTLFSTGGYSAEYGGALSSALILNTKEQYQSTRTDLGFMSVGADLAHTQVWENTSLAAKAEYTNLAPYQNLIHQDFDFEKAPESLLGNLALRQKVGNTGQLKFYGNYSSSQFILNWPNVDNGAKDRIDKSNNYVYLNGIYKGILNSKWSIKTGVSYTLNQEDTNINQDKLIEDQSGIHAKLVLDNDISDHVTIKFGGEHFHRNYDFLFMEAVPENTTQGTVNENLTSTFAEADIYLSNNFVFRTGLRGEYSQLLKAGNFAPRFSLAYKTSEHSQASMAYGKFHQTPQNEQTRVTTDLAFEKADHYILNYQHIDNDRTFRIEGYYKNYRDLVKFDGEEPFNPQGYNNRGNGYARGVDLFWRDQKSIKNVDYWVSYSFLDTERDFRDYPVAATPKFFSDHNFSVVYKHFIIPLQTQLGWSYTFASSRPYNDPNQEGFNQGQTPNYHDFSINLTYLMRSNVIIHFSASNVLGTDQTFGYAYASTPDENGVFQRQAIKPGAKRFLFLGVFITLTKDKILNQLRNL